MIVNKNIFRGYDLRGVTEKDLNLEIVEHLGMAYGTFLNDRGIKTAIVGRDCRLTSEDYSSALIKGISSTGVSVIDIGLAMAGTLYWAQYHFNSKGGVMVTASHNPAEYNGFKFAVDFSETMIGEQIQELRTLVEEEKYAKSNSPGMIEKMDIKENYFSDLKKRFNITKKFKAVVDPGNSTPGVFVPELLEKMGCEIIRNNCNLDCSFPLGTPDPTEKAMAERLGQKVKKEKADIGFSYDADGDRIGIADENGQIIWNDVLIALFSLDILERYPGATIMYNTLCSKVVKDVILKKGGNPFMWRTGHSFLKKKNQEVKAKFIGELSGHFFFSEDFYNHDDGCYTTLRLLDYLSKTGETLSELIAGLPKYDSSPEIKVGCADESKADLIKKISRRLKNEWSGRGTEIIDDERAGDGVRFDMDDSMFVIRYSQNGPYITVKFEAKTNEKYDELKNYIGKLLRDYNEIDWNYGVNTESLS